MGNIEMNKMSYEAIEIYRFVLGPYEQSHILTSFSHHPIHPCYACVEANLNADSTKIARLEWGFIIPRDGSSYTFSIVLPCGEQVNKR